MERHRRYLILAMLGALVISILYFLDILAGMWAIATLIFLFPLLSFSLFFSFMGKPKEKRAIDITRRRRYVT